MVVVAQLVRASDCGSGGRGFEPHHPPSTLAIDFDRVFCFYSSSLLILNLGNHFIYVLKSLKNNTYYKGRTTDLNKRLNEHNKGKTTYTKSGIPWVIVYFETLPSLDEAINRE